MKRGTWLAIVSAGAFLVAGPSSFGQTPAAPSEGVDYVTSDPGFAGSHLSIEGDRLYVGSLGLGMRIYDIKVPADPRLVGTYSPGIRADANPDAVSFGGRVIGTLAGTSRSPFSSGPLQTNKTDFLDVTDPSNPILLYLETNPNDGEAHNGDIFDERALWLPSGGFGNQGIRIYDLSPLLEDPPKRPQNLFRGSPVDLWNSSEFRGSREVGHGFTHIHDVTVYPDYPVRQPSGSYEARDIALYAEGGSYTNTSGNTGSVFVVDITDPSNPEVLNRWLHTSGADHTPIRYHHEVQFLDGDRSVMLITDEDLDSNPGECGEQGGVVAVRVTPDLTEATELSEWFIPPGLPTPVCSVHVFSSHADLVFFGSYNAGLQVVDYSDPTDPQRAGYYVAEGSAAWGAQFHQGYVYVSDVARGLDVFKWSGNPDGAAPPGGGVQAGTAQVKAESLAATGRQHGWIPAAALVLIGLIVAGLLWLPRRRRS